MRKGSLGVTFFSVCMSVHMSVRMSANFGKFNSECQGWLGMGQTTPRPLCPTSGPEADRKWTHPSFCQSVWYTTNYTMTGNRGQKCPEIEDKKNKRDMIKNYAKGIRFLLLRTGDLGFNSFEFCRREIKSKQTKVRVFLGKSETGNDV